MNSENVKKFQDMLNESGHHVTKPRTELFQLLDHPEPLSMRELLAKANDKIDRVSVYRNIELFESLGIVKRVHIGWKYKLELTDDFISHHHHLSCLRCAKVIDIEDEKHLDEFIKQISTKFNFKVIKHQFELEGYCRDCKKQIGKE
jgi:Fe2+ or Zn2+ uptake regulation protein